MKPKMEILKWVGLGLMFFPYFVIGVIILLDVIL